MQNKGEYVLTEEEYVYLFFVLERPELGEQNLKKKHPKMKWGARERFLNKGKESLIARGLVTSDETGALLTVDPELKTVFEYGLPIDNVLLALMSTPNGAEGINIYIREDGKWMAHFTFILDDAIHNRFVCGEAGEIPELIWETAGISKPAATKRHIESFARDAKESMEAVSLLKSLLEAGASRSEVFLPVIVGIVYRILVEGGEPNEQPHIVFLEGEKFSWFFRFDGSTEVPIWGVEQLKEEIAKLVG